MHIIRTTIRISPIIISIDKCGRTKKISFVLSYVEKKLIKQIAMYIKNSPKKVLRPTLFTLSKFLFFTSLITARIVEWLPKAIKNTKGISTIFILKLKYVSFWDKILNEKFFVAYPGNSTKRTKITYKYEGMSLVVDKAYEQIAYE